MRAPAHEAAAVIFPAPYSYTAVVPVSSNHYPTAPGSDYGSQHRLYHILDGVLSMWTSGVQPSVCTGSKQCPRVGGGERKTPCALHNSQQKHAENCVSETWALSEHRHNLE